MLDVSLPPPGGPGGDKGGKIITRVRQTWNWSFSLHIYSESAPSESSKRHNTAVVFAACSGDSLLFWVSLLCSCWWREKGHCSWSLRIKICCQTSITPNPKQHSSLTIIPPNCILLSLICCRPALVKKISKTQIWSLFCFFQNDAQPQTVISTTLTYRLVSVFLSELSGRTAPSWGHKTGEGVVEEGCLGKLRGTNRLWAVCQMRID